VTFANGWTGGQYSVWRAVLGTALTIQLAQLLAVTPLSLRTLWLAAAIVFSVRLALGADRYSALFVLLAAIPSPPLRLAVVFLAAMAGGRRVPYGSLAARGRVDPRGDWSMPEWLFAIAWLFLAMAHGYLGYARLPSLSALVELALVALFFLPRARPLAWLAELGLVLLGLTDRSLGMLLLHGFTFDPAWLPPRRDASPALLFYDGGCGLCHRAVRFVLAEDRNGRGFRCAALGGAAFELRVPPAERASLPDSLALVTADGRIQTRSAALREIGFRLGGLWRLLAGAAGIVPVGLLDRGYDCIARMRHRMFAKPDEACPILPPDLRNRFD